MKKITPTLICLMASVTYIFASEPPTPKSKNTLTQINSESYSSAVLVTESEMLTLTQNYEIRVPDGTWGGFFRKTDIQELISRSSAQNAFVNFRFCVDSFRTSLMLSITANPDQPESTSKCIRNGGALTAFCPTACNLNENAPPAINLPYEDYLSYSEVYKNNNPEQTIGGNIDKDALREILASIPAGTDRVGFKFCQDPETNKTSVIFIGGTVGQSGRKILMYRNGKDLESFCPTNCNRK